MKMIKVKVVKRADAAQLKTRRKRSAKPRAAAREIVSTVSDWVNDLKARKSDEAKVAFDLLFKTNRTAAES